MCSVAVLRGGFFLFICVIGLWVTGDELEGISEKSVNFAVFWRYCHKTARNLRKERNLRMLRKSRKNTKLT